MKRLVVAWAATALAATGAAVAVIGLLGNGITGTDGHVLSAGEVRSALATAATRTPSATGTSTGTPTSTGAPPSATPSRTPRDKLIRSAGGTVIASCDGGLVTLRSWSPAQDYSVDSVDAGPAREAKVEFEPDEGEDVELTIVCSGGSPVVRSR
ncbi:septum formation initiator [Nonomuraea fuscirosea]|nr:septum formation initiator [Nonomuraea fuscirosea]